MRTRHHGEISQETASFEKVENVSAEAADSSTLTPTVPQTSDLLLCAACPSLISKKIRKARHSVEVTLTNGLCGSSQSRT
jgi:hypothetical protein